MGENSSEKRDAICLCEYLSSTMIKCAFKYKRASREEGEEVRYYYYYGECKSIIYANELGEGTMTWRKSADSI